MTDKISNEAFELSDAVYEAVISRTGKSGAEIIQSALNAARNQALEDAAIQAGSWSSGLPIAVAIRAMKVGE